MEKINELLPISENDGKKAINARDLHTFLESKQQFADWIKNRIDKYDFVEGKDFETLYFDYQGNLLTIRHHNSMKSENQQVSKIEYALSIRMAKELSMVEGNEKGKQARKYFISCEEVVTGQRELSRKDLALMVIQAEEEKERLLLVNKELQTTVEENAPKVLFANAVIGSNSSCLIGELAKVISQNGFTIGQNRLFDWLRNNHYLGTVGERRNIPNQKYIEQGLFELKKGTRSGNEGVMHTTITTKITAKGQAYFINGFLTGRFVL